VINQIKAVCVPGQQTDGFYKLSAACSRMELLKNKTNGGNKNEKTASTFIGNRNGYVLGCLRPAG
jgi:hypothetical protein